MKLISLKHNLERIAFGLSAAAVLVIMTTSTAHAAGCGGNNQRACKVWERIPSCNKGLSEINRPGFCTKPKPIIVLPKPVSCGANGQRPCLVVERVPSCDAGLVEDFVRNQCVQKATGHKEVAKACYKNFKTVTKAMVPVANCVNRMNDLQNIVAQFKAKNADAVTQSLVHGVCKQQVAHAAQVMRQNGFASLSLGISGEVGTGIGAVSEFFLAINTNLQGRPHLYESIGYKFGYFTGGSLNGVITAHRGSASSLAGDGQAFSASFKALGGAGFSAGLSYANGNQDPNCVSTSVVAGAGVEANAGSLNRFTTLKLY